MEQIVQNEILQSIGIIYEEASECKMEASIFSKNKNHLQRLSSYFKLTQRQAFFCSLTFALSFKGEIVELNRLSQYLGCNPMKLLEYNQDFQQLYDKGILQKHYSGKWLKIAAINEEFKINQKIVKAILQSEPIPEVEPEKIKCVIDFLEELYRIGVARDCVEISSWELIVQTKAITSNYIHFPLVKRVLDFELSWFDTFFYFYLIWNTVRGNEKTDIGRAAKGMFSSEAQRFDYIQKLILKENELVKKDLVEIIEAPFFNDTEITLSDSSLELLKDCEINILSFKKQQKNVIKPESIPERALVFNGSEKQQLEMLQNLLMDDVLSKTQERLAAKNLPKGINVILHGLPGTGKTESALQLARLTYRKIMKVEISESKSMWYGESQKIVKRIFTNYKDFSKTQERMPILLFNEADAIFSVRKNHEQVSTSSSTDNAIQNIILEELENFEGILIATTNLIANLDKAFERRFLFKIKYSMPDLVSKSQIWKLKLPWLAESECVQLAERFNFSGAQIDNVVRKNEIHEVVYGTQLSFNTIVNFCMEELVVERVTIGFSNK